MNNNWLSNDGDSEGIYIDTVGQVGIGVTSSTDFHVSMKSLEANINNLIGLEGYTIGDLCQSFTVT